MPSRTVSVAVPFPIPTLLTYRVPDPIEMPVPGARVLVPLAGRQVTGIVAEVNPRRAPEVDAGASGTAIRDLVDVLDERPFLPPTITDLALWVADYYLCGPGEAVAAALPPGAWLQSGYRVRITEAGQAQAIIGVPGDRSGLRVAMLRGLPPGKWAPLGAVASRLKGSPGKRSRHVPALSLARALERDGLVQVEEVLRGRAVAFRTRRVAAPTTAGIEAARILAGGSDDAVLGRLGPRQRSALLVLVNRPEGQPVSALAGQNVSPDTLARLAARGLVTLRREATERDPFAVHVMPVTVQQGAEAATAQALPALTLTSEQTATLERLRDLARQDQFAVTLVHGVTGSGKTEIYLRLAEVVRARGRRALVLVPEIALTPALASVFRATFGDRLAIQHSGLSDGERHDQWQRIRRDEVDVVVGTRSAVFAPLSSLGLIIVDEEHDASYKQEESPRYHGRDVAVMRAKREGALVVLGSATPSLESYHNARTGRYGLLTLERRVLDRPLASVELVNMREEYAELGPDLILSRRLASAIGERLDRAEQVLLLLNRRGFSTVVFCRQCTEPLDCPNCSVSLTVHLSGRSGRRARCHYCNYSIALPHTCPRCAAPYMEQSGCGTERIEAEVQALFPGARVARLDRDTASARGAPAELLGRFARGQISVLVGTQMVAKGHDFPKVTLVGVISADVGLGLADFRAAERTFQLLTQVVGRAGRGEQPGDAIIQTLYPEHYSIQLACRQNYVAFYEREIAFRRAMRYPPVVGLVNGVVGASSLAAAFGDANEFVRRLRQQASSGGGFTVLGPAPAPLVRLRGEHRVQFFLKGRSRTGMKDALRRALADRPTLARRLTIDIDPLKVL
jgi:primosomal protein N' (replication factor Y) (superfamily II helicase)